jgi:subtilisin family serine protease
VRLAELLELDPRALAPSALAPVEVAILDTGIDSRHPDLQACVVEAYELVRSGPRFRAIRREVPCANDPIGHGTGVASTIAAIAPNARLIDIQVVTADKVGSGEALLAGLRLAVERGCPLVNLSLACHARLLPQLIEAAYFQNQILVAARRNMPLVDNGLPAQLSSVIGVDATDVPSPFELRYRDCHRIEFIARGDEMLVAAPGGRYTLQSGASYASSTVTGLCALYLGCHPGITPYEMKALLKERASAEPVG